MAITPLTMSKFDAMIHIVYVRPSCVRVCHIKTKILILKNCVFRKINKIEEKWVRIPLPAPIKTKNAPFTGAFFVLKVGGDRLRTHEGSGIERSEDEQALPERQCRAPSHCPLQFIRERKV